MTLTNTLRTGLRAGVVALTLAGTAAVAVPAQAASPNIGFSLNFGMHAPKGGITLHFGDRDYWRFCLSDSQVRSALRSKGYRDVRIVREDRRSNKVLVVAQKRGDWYSMRVDRCTGKVDRVEKVRRNRGGSFDFRLTF
jgi:hypothetical protein